MTAARRIEMDLVIGFFSLDREVAKGHSLTRINNYGLAAFAAKSKTLHLLDMQGGSDGT